MPSSTSRRIDQDCITHSASGSNARSVRAITPPTARRYSGVSTGGSDSWKGSTA